MKWKLTGAAALGAILVVVSFAPANIGFAVLFAWVPLLVLAPALTWRQRFMAGWLMGTLYQAGLFRWILFTTREMSGLPLAAGAAALLSFALWHGLMCGIFLALSEPARRVADRLRPGLGLLAIGALFAAVEWSWPILFPWALGHALWRVPQIASLMAWTGTPGLSCLVVLVSACAADMIIARQWRGARYGLVGLLTLLSMGLGWWWYTDSAPTRRTLTVGVLQMNYSLEEKKHANMAMRQRLFKRLTKTLATMPPGAVDLLVGSEGAFPLYWDVTAIDDNALKRPRVPLSTRATRTVADLVAIGPRTDTILGGLRIPPGEQIRNSAVHVHPDGVLGDHYDKQVLVPFGEYLPGTTLFPSLKGRIAGISDLGAGDRPCRFEAAGEVVACGICYETIFTGLTRREAADATVLVNMTIDVWFGVGIAPWFHLMSQASRAVELGIPLVRAALTGISTVVDIDGQPIALLGVNEAGVLEVEVPLKDITTPYRVVGPLFGWLTLIASGLLLLGAWRRPEENTDLDVESETTEEHLASS